MSDYMERAQEFAARLAGLYGDELVSVGLYGSAARGQFQEGASDLNVLVILRELDAERLRRASPLAREWAEAGNPPPLMFSELEWAASADVFPIEYTDIQSAHLVLHGADPFADVNVRWEHLRLMCEHELKAKKVALRERYLLAAEAPDELGALLTGSVSTFVTLFRATLRLLGEEVPGAPEAVVKAVADRAGFEAGPMLEALSARSTVGFAPAADDHVVVGYLAAVGSASDWLDGLSRPAGAGETV